jgi:hypothetical protein
MVLAGVVMAGVFALLFGVAVLLLWNWLMPDIFGLPEISYWQAWGIVLLAHILFKAGRWTPRSRHDHSWKEKMRSRFEKPETHGEGESTSPPEA